MKLSASGEAKTRLFGQAISILTAKCISKKLAIRTSPSRSDFARVTFSHGSTFETLGRRPMPKPVAILGDDGTRIYGSIIVFNLKAGLIDQPTNGPRLLPNNKELAYLFSSCLKAEAVETCGLLRPP